MILLFLVLSSCSINNNHDNKQVDYTHYASGGVKEDYKFDILFEESNSTFTSYQIAYASCTCRDSLTNYRSVCYVEILNTKKNPEDAAIRYITFSENKGLWGDSNPNYYKSEYTEEYYDEHLVKPLIGISKKEIDSWTGYGYSIDAVDIDAISGATVSSSNLFSMLKSLFNYHVKKYYNNSVK